ncbi:hypothetical protein HK097_007700 [Rhizophlyctis rosea]|uniref:RING-type domain-containing protein n=1 Tax=Rhizophlyctis rosea TaxID=64517 RepID=A0AAD5SQC3_9FUNG|nr:hypothetical protein HK097_007700 [Rhizophlyctis rosea]
MSDTQIPTSQHPPACPFSPTHEPSSPSSPAPETTAPPAPHTTTCPICLAPITSLSYTTPCYHSYDKPCIQTWLSSCPSPNCPQCRRPIESLIYDIAPDLETHKVYHLTPRNTKSPTRRRSMAGGSILENGAGGLGLAIRDKRRRVYTRNLEPVLPPDLVARMAHVREGVNIPPSFRLPADKVPSRIKEFFQRDLQVILDDSYEDWMLTYCLDVLRGACDVEKAAEGVKEVMPDERFAAMLLRELRIFEASKLAMDRFDEHVEYIP